MSSLVCHNSFPPALQPGSLGKHGCQSGVAGQVVLPWQPSVVERVHVDHGISLHHDGRLGLVFDPPLAGERQPDLVGHGAAEGALERAGTKSTVTEGNRFCSVSGRMLKLGSAEGKREV